MKNLLKIIVSLLLAFSLCACANNTPPTTETPSGTESDSGTPVESATETETEPEEVLPELVEGVHNISVAEVESILAANGLSTNLDSNVAIEAYHGGHQLRVCHTERGTYSIFVRAPFPECYPSHLSDGPHFYIAKTDNNGNTEIIYCGDLTSESSPALDIAQDINGNVIAATTGPRKLSIFVIDKDTDEVTEYSSRGSGMYDEVFYTLVMGRHCRTMFDFENRKIAIFYNGDLDSGDYTVEWFIFDLETMQWMDGSCFKRIEGFGRHVYMYPLPDGNGGFYIVGERDIPKVTMSHILKVDYYGDYFLWDELKLFHVPDMTTIDNFTYTHIQEAYTERADEGYWSNTSVGHSGTVTFDKNGYLHITYWYATGTVRGQYLNYTREDTQWRHAIFDGMECIYNERIDFIDALGNYSHKAALLQDKDRNLYLLDVPYRTEEDGGLEQSDIKIYKANDELGTDWTQVTTLTLPKEIDISSFSTSQPENGSTMDSIISCFFYGKYRGTDDYSVFTFNLSLEDYSVTEVVDILKGYDLPVNGKMDKRAYNASHANKIVHTENGTYAAFVYNYKSDDKTEEFHIVKIGEDKSVKILYTGSYSNTIQDKFLTVEQLADGRIYVFLSNCKDAYCIDPATDEVTEVTVAKSGQGMGQQTELIYNADGSANLVLGMSRNEVFSLLGYTIDTETMYATSDKLKYTFDTEILGNYPVLYSFSDGNKGAYIVGSNWKNTALIADKLNYNGQADQIPDTITMFYIPDLSAKEVQCITVQAPDESRGAEGVWSVVDLSEVGDVYMDAEGKLHILYALYTFDYDDADRRENPALIADTLKLYHVIYNGTELVSKEELDIDGLTTDTTVRMAQATDGTFYLITCERNKPSTRLDVYLQTEEGWALTQIQKLGDITAESISISSPRSGSVQDNVIDCLIYATDNDVYYTQVVFGDK